MFSVTKVSEPFVSSESMEETRAVTKAEVAMVREKAKSLGLRVKKVHRRISMEEFDERYSKWLCMFCGEQETPDHHLQHKNEVILVIDCGEEQLPVMDDETDLLEEEAMPQFQVPVSDSEIVRSIEPGKVDLELEKLEHVVMNENLEQDWVQKNVKTRFEADGDVERGQKVMSDAKTFCAHKVFVKMPSKEKRIKQLKGWKFKFKRKSLVGIMLPIEQYKLRKRRRRMYNKLSTNIKDESMKVMIPEKHQSMVRQLHKSRVQCKMRMRNDSWGMRRLTLKIMMSHRKHKWKSKHLQIASNFWINHPHKLADLILRTALTEQDMSLARVDWRTKNSTPFVMQSIMVQEMVPMQDNETATKTYLGQAHELQDTTGSITKRLSPPVICYHNFRRRFCSLTWYSSASLEEWKHKLDMDLCGYKIQILQLSNHDSEMQMLPCLQSFSVVRMGIHVVFCLQELKPIWGVGYNEAVGVTSTKQELSHWSVASHVKRDAQESFGSKGLAYAGCVILETNFVGFERGKTELLTSEFEDRFKSWSRSIVKLLFQNSLVHHQQTVNADDERHIMVCVDKSDGQWFWMVFVRKPADPEPAISTNQEHAIFQPDNAHGMITRGKDGFVKLNLRYILLADQRIWEKETHAVDITDAYSVLQEELEQVVNHTPFSVVELERPQDHDALLLLLPGDERFQIKHKWRFKLLELELYMDSLVLITSYAHQFDIISLIILMSVELFTDLSLEMEYSIVVSLQRISFSSLQTLRSRFL